MIGAHESIDADVTRDTTPRMRTEAVADDEQQALQAALFRFGGIGESIIVFLIVTTATVLPRGKILLLHKGGWLRFEEGNSVG